jgi:hypothetical protein
MEVFNLNIRPGKTCPVIHCSQFDKGRTFRANLYDGSEVFTLTAAETLSVIEKKSDGNMVTIGVTNTSDSYVEFATTEQMTALAGPQICELRIVEGDTLIGSANFILDCEESPDTGIESESEIHNLETQIQDINNEIVPDLVAEEVENQYDSQNVIFDDAPTENHGTGYAVTSEGVKNALDGKPDNLSDLGDVNISSPTSNQALVYNPDTHKWENAMIPQTGTIEDVAIASFSDGADDVPVSELIVDIKARQAGSGTPSPDNVRAIHGWTKCNLTRAGKNLCPKFTKGVTTINGVTFTTNSDGTILATGTPTARATLYCDGTLPKLPTGTYKISAGLPKKQGYMLEYWVFQNGETAYYSTRLGSTDTFTINEGDYVKSIYISIYDYAGSGLNLLFKPMLELGSTDTEYEVFNGGTYTFDFGQTVYGGHFDNKGNLVVTHSFIASYNGENINEPWISSMDNYVPNTLPSIGAQVVYPLTTPISLSITSKDVRTLLGNNNIFADTGNINRLEYFKTGCENIAKLIEAAPNLASVQSVNGRTGAVELDAFNTPYDSENSIAEKVETIPTYASQMPLSPTDDTKVIDAIGGGFEEGSSGVWTWRKWKNGILELWGNSDEIYTGTFNSWGSVFSLDVSGLGSYPIPFVRIDAITGSCAMGGANASSSITNFNLDNLLSAPGYIMIRGTNIGSDNRRLVKNLYVKGTWK